MAKKHPEKVQELLAYHYYHSSGSFAVWMSYDRMFREHVEKEPSSNWSLLHSKVYMYLLSFLSQQVEASTCPKCMGSVHPKAECALSALEPQQEPFRSRQAEWAAIWSSEKEFLPRGHSPVGQVGVFLLQ